MSNDRESTLSPGTGTGSSSAETAVTRRQVAQYVGLDVELPDDLSREALRELLVADLYALPDLV